MLSWDFKEMEMETHPLKSGSRVFENCLEWGTSSCSDFNLDNDYKTNKQGCQKNGALDFAPPTEEIVIHEFGDVCVFPIRFPQYLDGNGVCNMWQLGLSHLMLWNASFELFTNSVIAKKHVNVFTLGDEGAFSA